MGTFATRAVPTKDLACGDGVAFRLVAANHAARDIAHALFFTINLNLLVSHSCSPFCRSHLWGASLHQPKGVTDGFSSRTNHPTQK